jgi:phosphoadenosine phosphosulfate reductase|tara:strand:+ start:391 stop:1149 length:759 start_codon:yes stop_codon:yes gene_type:complete
MDKVKFPGFLDTLVKEAIDILVEHEPPEGYYGAFSGGKDSVVVENITSLAPLKHPVDWHYCVSPIDPPQVYPFIRENYPHVQWDYHARNFWGLVVRKGLPMRTSRWCCQYIKEAGGIGRTVILGNRKAEGGIRRKQDYYQKHHSEEKWFVRPILNFDDDDVWAYITSRGLPYLSLYDQGFTRVGCVLCPFSRKVEREIEFFPKIAANWLRVCGRIVEDRQSRDGLYKDGSGREYKQNFATKEELFAWWIRRD